RGTSDRPPFPPRAGTHDGRQADHPQEMPLDILPSGWSACLPSVRLRLPFSGRQIPSSTSALSCSADE
uniref:hypothetical protein n=1 Tax=Phocaeicola sp. TaxID=2773926 RepID=UPI003FEF177C